MYIIGEKINGSIPRTAEAIKNRDESYIIGLIRAQEDAGADYLDVCAGTQPEEEYETLCWLVDIVQEHSSKPICIDSPNPRILERIFPRISKPGIINSISGEGDKCEVLLPLLRDNSEWQAVVLCCDNRGIPASADEKVNLAFNLIEEAGKYGVSPDRLHIDPLVLALSAVNDSAVQFCDAIRRIKEGCPTVNVAAAISNVSFGLPARGLVNRNFLTLTIAAGLDTIIADPTNRDIIGNIYATEMLMGKDKYCRRFNNAFRAGKIGPIKH